MRTGNTYFIRLTRSTVNSLLIAVLLITTFIKVQAQDNADFGQYVLFKPLINPAASASYSEALIFFYAREQWSSIIGAPTSVGSQFILPFRINSLGFSIKQEAIGVHKKQSFITNYTHKVALSRTSQLAFGLGIGAEIISSNYSDITTTETGDNIFGENQSSIGPEMNFGVYFFNQNLHLGFSIPSLIYTNTVELNGNIIDESKIDLDYWQYQFIGGYIFNINESIDLDISGLAMLTENAPAEFDINTQLKIQNTLGLGVSYKTKREVLIMANYKLKHRLQLGYGYHSYFGFNGHLLSGHELICLFNLAKKKEATLQTPRF